jgi:protein gp37
MGNAKYQADGDPRTSGPGFGLTEHDETLKIPLGWRSPRTVFVNSMSDLWHAHVSDDFIHRVFNVMAATPQHTYQLLTKRPRRVVRMADDLPWPSNVWMGVSVESQAFAWRCDDLRNVPAAVRFVSAEPLLELVTLNLDGISWLIAGGESGPNHRPLNEAWVRDLRDQCQHSGTAFFFKQWGGVRPKSGGRNLDGRTWDDMPPLAVANA